jgi:hypothetical protein
MADTNLAAARTLRSAGKIMMVIDYASHPENMSMNCHRD